MKRRRFHFLVSALVLALAAFVFTGCGNSDRRFNGHGVSFRYPHNWAPAESAGVNVKTSNGLWTEMFSPTAAAKDPGGTTADIVLLTKFRAPTVTKEILAASVDNISAGVAQLAQKAGGRLLAGPSKVTMGGLPGYEYRFSAKTVRGRGSASRLVLVWKGNAEYSLNCQHLVGGTRAAEIERGCKMIVGSFKLG